MTLRTLQPAEEERLLGLVDALVAELSKVRVHLVEGGGGAPAGQGVPASCVGNVVSFLERERDLDRLRDFVDRLDRLDRMVAQNQRNPRAHHHALREVLRHWLDRHRDLDPERWLYLLGWTRRLLPKPRENGNGHGNGARGHRPGRQRARASETPRPEAEPPQRGGQLGDALMEAMKRREGK
jgi:hypothetical protein